MKSLKFNYLIHDCEFKRKFIHEMSIIQIKQADTKFPHMAWKKKKPHSHGLKKEKTSYINKARSLHLHNSRTSPAALDIQYQSQDLIQGMDCIFLEEVVQRR